MELIDGIIQWQTENQDYIGLFKDVVFALGVIATIYGYFKILRYLGQRKTLNKKSEMEYDLKLYGEINEKLKEHVDSYGATPGNLRDIGIRLLYIKNYPYKLDDDGYPQMLYYYFMSDNHKAGGYVSGKGLYVMEHLWFLSEAIYYNPDNEKWFIDKKGKKFKKFRELKHKQLVRRIPFANIYGYDFNSDWADKGEPVFYTKYKYYKWKLYADELEAVTIDEEFHLANKVSLEKKKRARRVRTYLNAHKNRIIGSIRARKSQKQVKKAMLKNKNTDR